MSGFNNISMHLREGCGARNDGSMGCWRVIDDISTFQCALHRKSVEAFVGVLHECATTEGGIVECCIAAMPHAFGKYPARKYGSEAEPIPELRNVVRMSAGIAFVMALTATGEVMTWGFNHGGQLGLGDTQPRSIPETIKEISGSDIAAGGYHACAVVPSAEILCWGRGVEGQTATPGLPAVNPTPTSVRGLAGARSISAGLMHTCTVLKDGQVLCWGSNKRRQVNPNLALTIVQDPVAVPGISRTVQVSAGLWHTCALDSDGKVSCWGDVQCVPPEMRLKRVPVAPPE